MESRTDTADPRLLQYVEDVKSGKVLTCKMVRLAIARFERDLKASEAEDFPYYFDPSYANKVIRFIETLKQYEGEFAGKPLILEPWQIFIVCNLYGWRIKTDPSARRFLKSFIFVARKNGKTLLLSALALYDLLTEKGAQVYSGATRREQAAIAFNNVVQFVKHNPTLQELLGVYRNSIVYEKTASKFMALSSESKLMDGLNPSLAILDEVAAQGNSGLVDVLQSGTYARKSPLLLEITTGGFNQESVGKKEYDGSKAILLGNAKDDRYFCILYETDEGDKWTDETTYIKANPNLNVSISLEKLLFARDEAVRMPYKESEFKVKNLNRWENANTAWIKAADWAKCTNQDIEVTEEILQDAMAVGAVDLSKRSDITAFTLYFYLPELNKFYAKHKFYIPEGQIEAKLRNESMQFRHWIDMGYVTAIPGEVIDYDYMYEDIREALDTYRIAEIAYDDWNAVDLVKNIGLLTTLVNFPQNYKHMSPAAKDWEAAIISGSIIDDNPVLAWMISCCVVYRDASENIKPKKDGDASSSKRIDGVITSLMSFSRLRARLNGVDSSLDKEDLLAFYSLAV